MAGAAITVGVMTNASASATTMYNMTIRNDALLPDGISNRVGGTDGWVWGSTDDSAAFNWNYSTTTPDFAGTGAGNPTPIWLYRQSSPQLGG